MIRLFFLFLALARLALAQGEGDLAKAYQAQSDCERAGGKSVASDNGPGTCVCESEGQQFGTLKSLEIWRVGSCGALKEKLVSLCHQASASSPTTFVDGQCSCESSRGFVTLSPPNQEFPNGYAVAMGACSSAFSPARGFAQGGL